MDIHLYVKKYGVVSTSITLKRLAQRLRDASKDVDMAVIIDMADDLQMALEIVAMEDA